MGFTVKRNVGKKKKNIYSQKIQKREKPRTNIKGKKRDNWMLKYKKSIDNGQTKHKEQSKMNLTLKNIEIKDPKSRPSYHIKFIFSYSTSNNLNIVWYALSPILQEASVVTCSLQCGHMVSYGLKCSGVGMRVGCTIKTPGGASACSTCCLIPYLG